MTCLIHYSIDNKTRLCTGRKKGKDELTEDWSSVTCNGCLLKRMSMQLILTEEENAFRTFKDNVFDFAEEKGFLGDGKIESSLILEFMSHLAVYKMMPKNHDIDIPELPKEYEVAFFDWFLFEREIKKGKTITELYIKSKKFKDDYNREIREYIKDCCVPDLREPVWSVFTITGKLDDHLFNVNELFTDEWFQIHANFAPGKASVGVFFFGKLGTFGEYSYAGIPVKLLSEADVRVFLELKEFIETLEDRFTTFLARDANLSFMTLQMYEESFSILLSYIPLISSKTINHIKVIDVKKLMKWAKEEYHLSDMESKKIQKLIMAFLNYL